MLWLCKREREPFALPHFMYLLARVCGLGYTAKEQIYEQGAEQASSCLLTSPN